MSRQQNLLFQHSVKIGRAIAGLVMLGFLVSLPNQTSFFNSKSAPVFQPEASGLEASIQRRVARDDYYRMIYGDPTTGSIPPGIKTRELEYAKGLPKIDGMAAKNAALSMNWAEAGPNDVSGRVRAIAIDVNDPATILSGGVSGGIWKSTNSGADWTLVSESHLAVTRVVQDTRSGHTSTWYAGTGEKTGSSFNNGSETGENLHGTGIYKSSDNGNTWARIQASGPATATSGLFDFVQEMVVSPTTGTVFALLNQNGLHRSTDSGSTFTRVLGTDGKSAYSDVAVDATGNLLAVMYNLVDFDASGVYRSVDDGATWIEVFENNGTEFPDPYNLTYRRTVVALSASNPDIAYLLTDLGAELEPNTRSDVRLFKLTISTGTYEDRSANIPNFIAGPGNWEGTTNVGGYNTQGGYNMAIAVHPTDENHVVIGGTNLFRSRDGFATLVTDAADGWIGGYATANDISQYANHHPDNHVLLFDPSSPNRLYSGHDGGISVNSDVSTVGAVAWTRLNNKYNITQYYMVSIARAAGDNRITGGTQDNGSPFFLFDGTTTTASADLSSGDGAYQYLGANDLYSSSQSGGVNYYRDNNGTLQYYGRAIPDDAANKLFIHPYTVDKSNETIVFYPGGAELFRGVAPDDINTYEHTWTKLTDLELPGGYGFSALSTSEAGSPGVLYYAGYSASAAPKIYRFADAATATTGAVERSIPGAEPGGYVLNIAVNPQDSEEILISIANYNTESLYYSSDGGQSYTAVQGNLAGTGDNGPSVRAGTILPMNGEKLYVVTTSTGTYSTQTMNGSSTVWSQEGEAQMGSVAGAWIDSRVSDGKIVVGTHGRGAFVGTPATVTANTAPVASAVSGSSLEDADVSVTLSATDGDSDPLTYSIVDQPANGTVVLSGTSAAYTPAADFNGTDSFTYKANDGSDDSNSATVTLTVAAVNDTPSFTVGADQMMNLSGGAQSITGWATDISAGPANESSQTVSFTLTPDDTSLFADGPTVSADGTLTYTPAANAGGSTAVAIYISDDGGSDNNGFDASADQSFMVEIVNDTANEDQAIPTEFTLSGAYPNPFNPTTTIQFGLPAAADVQVQVFDLTGRMVMTVPSKTFTAGAKHSVRLNASTLASGSYYYRVLASLSGGTEVKVGSFVLLK
jgi:hypothetical protein